MTHFWEDHNQIIEALYKDREWAVRAIMYAFEHYVDDIAAQSEILAFINGYEGSPDFYEEVKRQIEDKDRIKRQNGSSRVNTE